MSANYADAPHHYYYFNSTPNAGAEDFAGSTLYVPVTGLDTPSACYDTGPQIVSAALPADKAAHGAVEPTALAPHQLSSDPGAMDVAALPYYRKLNEGL